MSVTEQKMRSALMRDLEPHGLLVEEVTVRTSSGIWRNREARLDVALFSDGLHGYEIKSDQDTLKRLDRQLEVYGRVCSTVTVVAAKYAQKILDQAPDWVGVMTLYEGVLQTLRPSLTSPRFSLRDLCENLWKAELRSILKKNGMRHSGYCKDTLADMVCKLDERGAYEACLSQLKTREWKWWRPEAVS